MFSPRSNAIRLLSVALPACFLWVFVACVSLCSSHVAEGHESSSTLPAAAAENSHEDDCCPILEVPSGALPGRQSDATTPRLGGDVQASPAPPLRSGGFALRLPARRLNLPSNADPPPERLGVLRI